jgi:site-specific DNA recombinase
MMNNKKKAAGYIRVSTLQQVESGTSLEEQKSIIEKEAKHRDLNLTKIYSDEGISGKSIVRPALRELLDDSKQGRFDIILFTKLDRLARNLRDTLNIFHEANELGIDLFCIDNPAISTNGPMGSVMLSVLATFAQFERELIRSRTTAGRINKWKSGESIMGHLPFGYIKNDKTKKIEIDDYKKQIIHKIFSLCPSGKPIAMGCSEA